MRFLKIRKKVTEEQLYKLINRMTAKEPVRSSAESDRWWAYRDAENITDRSAIPLLMKIVRDNPQKDRRKIRRAAYFIMNKMLKRSFDKATCEYLIERLNYEKDKYVLSGIMSQLQFLTIPPDVDIGPIIACSKSEKWLIRDTAINALGASATPESRDALTDFLKRSTDEKRDKYAIAWAIFSLARIGDPSVIPLLGKYADSRSLHIRYSARSSIEALTHGSMPAPPGPGRKSLCRPRKKRSGKRNGNIAFEPAQGKKKRRTVRLCSEKKNSDCRERSSR